jgi:DNA-directed RNA polymerase alpha subunit
MSKIIKSVALVYENEDEEEYDPEQGLNDSTSVSTSNSFSIEPRTIKITPYTWHPKRYKFKNDNRMSFQITGIDDYFANAVRRIILEQVPTLAIEEVLIEKNTTVYHDQMLIAQRLLFHPIYSQHVHDLVFPQDCECYKNVTLTQTSTMADIPHCKKCSIVLSLDVVNCNEDETLMIVSDKDWRVEGDDEKQSKRLRYLHFPDRLSYQSIKIIELGYKQELKCRVIVRKGYGMTHQKWIPTTVSTFTPVPHVKLFQERFKKDRWTEAEKKSLVDICPRQVLRINDFQVDLEDASLCSLCEECYRYSDMIAKKVKRPILIGESKTDFIFDIVSKGTRPSYDILSDAIDILIKKIKSIKIV